MPQTRNRGMGVAGPDCFEVVDLNFLPGSWTDFPLSSLRPLHVTSTPPPTAATCGASRLMMTDQARWKATVYVGGIAPMVTAANLQAAFLPFGEIADVSLP
jgi:hypothetical protein